MARSATEAAQPRHCELLVAESTGSKTAIGASQIEALPRQLCAAQARASRSRFPRRQGTWSSERARRAIDADTDDLTWRARQTH